MGSLIYMNIVKDLILLEIFAILIVNNYANAFMFDREIVRGKWRDFLYSDVMLP